MQTFDQQRSMSAMNAIQALNQSLSNQEKKELRASLRALPGKILINRLMATSAYLEQKEEHVYKVFSPWLLSASPTIDWRGKSSSSLLDRLTSCSTLTLRQATEEALEYAEWLKRWGNALLMIEPANDKPANVAPGKLKP